jgi:hypothetical protein
MQNPEIRTRRDRRTLFDKLRGWPRAYEVRIADDRHEVVGRGPTPDAAQNEATRLWGRALLADLPK